MRVRTSSQSVRRWIADDRARKAYDPVQRPGLDFSGTCSSPILLEVDGAPDAVLQARGGRAHARKLFADMYVMCRKCEACLKHRAKLWTARAIDELRLAERTWFGTLTLSPQAHHVALAKARRVASQNAIDFDGLEANEQFQMRHQIIGHDLQLWMKRVRKNSGVPVRYLLVCEAHKSGLPHYHALIHQVNDSPVTYRDLAEAWHLGFTNFRLVDGDPKTAFYTCKYLAKSALARVRASAAYGRGASPQHRKPEGEQAPEGVPEPPACHSEVVTPREQL